MFIFICDCNCVDSSFNSKKTLLRVGYGNCFARNPLVFIAFLHFPPQGEGIIPQIIINEKRLVSKKTLNSLLTKTLERTQMVSSLSVYSKQFAGIKIIFV